MSAPFEGLGTFYLGKEVDTSTSDLTDDLVLYDAQDLTTHGFIVGMTGSGKTGLGVSLIEEAALDGIPVIAIDPKGDLGNLLLTFPKLRPQDFAPWVDHGEATRNGQTPTEYAASVASLWKKGIGQWGQDGKRIERLRQAVDVSIYTPGSQAGMPLTVLKSFDAPPPALLQDGEAFAERVNASASGLLGLLGIDADPMRSREHVLLANILHRAWQEGRNLTLADLIRSIQAPQFKRVGVLDLDSFFPPADRFQLAMSINSLLASPSFAVWMEGEPLDIQRLLWTPEGKPRVTILSIAHLTDAQRMFFVTTLLTELLAWVRTQPGTSSLRALFYMDEVFGYFPPVANPPSKGPMLTLLKQARAFGLGCMLATQNPVEQEGTYPLPEAQLDRFLFKLIVGFPDRSAEVDILKRSAELPLGADSGRTELRKVMDRKTLRAGHELVNSIRLDDTILTYIVDLVRATRSDGEIQYGASTRAADAISSAVRAMAAMEGRDYAIPDDVQALVLPALRHRLLLGPSAEIEGRTPDDVLGGIINRTDAPR